MESGLHGKTEYRYNSYNQQTAVLMKDGGIQENWYDAESLRAEVAENGKRSRFLYYNGELLAESGQDETVISRYILGYGVAAGWQKEKEGYHSYHLDEQNSTAYITDSNQRIENSYLYHAFGTIRSKNESVHNRILYTGQQYDQVTGQYYLRARYYNPVVGRFLQEDVYRGDGLNLYAYCVNNPVIYYDPSGYNDQQNNQCDGKDKIEEPVTDKAGKYPDALKDPDVNVYTLPDETLQQAMDTITQDSINRLSNNGEKTLFNGGPRQAMTITPEGQVVISQNSSSVDMAGRQVAIEMFGDKVEFVRGGKNDVMPNMPENYGAHAEPKGINYLQQHDMTVPGSKQFSSHYSCGSCETVQNNYGIDNRTGVVSQTGTQSRDLNPF